MTRVVLDTNVVVSAFLKPSGAEALVLLLGLSRTVQLLISEALLGEYQLVLSKPKFKLDPSRVAEGLENIRKTSQRVKPTSTLSVCPHEPDNRILECAEAARAHYVITGNKRHFPEIWREIKVVRAREFLERSFPELKR